MLQHLTEVSARWSTINTFKHVSYAARPHCWCSWVQEKSRLHMAPINRSLHAK
jgi:hypothetical protein